MTYTDKYSKKDSTYTDKYSKKEDAFLLQENRFFILLEDGSKIIASSGYTYTNKYN